MFNATISIAISVFLGLASVHGATVVGEIDAVSHATDYEVYDGIVVTDSGDGMIGMTFHDITTNFGVADFAPCWDCADDLADGHDYISYVGVPAHVDDIVTTLVLTDSDGECMGRMDFVSYCPHNN